LVGGGKEIDGGLLFQTFGREKTKWLGAEGKEMQE
jgi:hypothetical protein